MNWIHRLLCALTALFLCLPLCLQPALAMEPPRVFESLSSPEEFEGFRSLDGGWIITGYTGNAELVDVPEWVEGVPVYQLTDRMMFLNQSVVKLVLPRRLDSIGNSAFMQCSSLEEVIFPQRLNFISSYAFSKCAKLREINLPDTLEMISESAFSYCHSLTEVTIPSGVTGVGRYAFAHCEGLTAVTLPDSLTLLDEGLFYACPKLAQVIIPASVTKIRPYCFDECPLLVLTVTPGTEGERYAKENGIPFRYGE